MPTIALAMPPCRTTCDRVGKGWLCREAKAAAEAVTRDYVALAKFLRLRTLNSQALTTTLLFGRKWIG